MYEGKSRTIVLALQIGNCPLEKGKNDCSVELIVEGAKSKLDARLGLDMSGPLFVGGRPVPGQGVTQRQLAQASFVGCLRELTLGMLT